MQLLGIFNKSNKDAIALRQRRHPGKNGGEIGRRAVPGAYEVQEGFGLATLLA